MCRMPQKQAGSQKVLNCVRCCFYRYGNLLPFCWPSIKLKYANFLTTFWFSAFHFIFFVKAEFFHVNLPFQKENTWRKHCVYNHGNTIRFTYTYIQITLLSVDFIGDKNIAFNVSDACLFGHPVYFDYQDFLSFTSNFPFQVLMEENYEKRCNWI